MRLANKFTLALMAGTTLVLAANSYLHIRRQNEQFDADMRRDHLLLARAIEAALNRHFAVGGSDAEARSLARAVAAKESTVEIQWVPEASASELGITEGERAGIDAVGVVLQRETDKELRSTTGIASGGARHGVLVLTESLEDERSYVRGSLVQAIAEFATTLLVCAGLALLLGVFFVGRPMQQLVGFARQIGGGDFTPRLHLAQRDEIGELAAEMNAMAEHLQQLTQKAAKEQAARLAALEQLRHAERLATVGKLAAGIAHELGTPLAVVAGRARLIVDEPTKEPGTHAKLILEQTGGIVKIVRQLMDFARRRPPVKSNEELGRLAQGTLEFLRPMAEKRQVELALEVAEAGLEVKVDAGQIQQALTNLVVNGLQAMSRGGRLVVRVGVAAAARPPADVVARPERWLALAVTDEGEGIKAEDRERIFEPFFTTKGVGEGTGLGLSVTYGIVHEHGGWISVETEVGHGSCFTAFLPGGA